MLRIVAAAEDVRQAAENALEEVVAEAHFRGATWAQIGAQLKIGKTAAHKRFSGKVKNHPRLLLPANAEKEISEILLAVWASGGGSEAFGYDEGDWEAVPPMVNAHYCWYYIVGAGSVLEAAFLKEDDYDLLQTAGLSTRMIGKAFQAFATSEVFAAFEEACSKAPLQIRTDMNPMAYFVRCFYIAMLAQSFITHAIDSYMTSPEDTFRSFVAARAFLLEAMFTALRPECIAAINFIEKQVVESGNTPQKVLYPKELELDIDLTAQQAQELVDTYWRGGDLNTLAHRIGVSPSQVNPPNLGEVLAKLHDEQAEGH
jgi:hypothetical protein